MRDIDPQYVKLPSDVSFRTQRTVARQQNTSSTPQQQATARRVQQQRSANSTPSDFIPSDPSQISTGQQVEHTRFGLGKVIGMEGSGEHIKATIFFTKHGQKNLLLKFAKLKIID